MYLGTLQTGPGRTYRDGSLGAVKVSSDMVIGIALGTALVWVLMRGLTLPGTAAAAAAAR